MLVYIRIDFLLVKHALFYSDILHFYYRTKPSILVAEYALTVFVIFNPFCYFLSLDFFLYKTKNGRTYQR